MATPKVFICSRIRGDLLENRRRMRLYARYVALSLEMDPEATGDYFCQFLDETDVKERSVGMLFGQGRLLTCAALLFVVDGRGVSDGMEADLAVARKFGIEVIEKTHDEIVEWFLENDPRGLEFCLGTGDKRCSR